MHDLELKIRPDQLAGLLRIGIRLTAERELEPLLALIIDETTKVMDAERSSLFLIDREQGQMWAKIAQGVNVEEIRFPLGKGIAGTVGATGVLINIPDAYADRRFNPEFDRQTGFRTKSILCAPLRNRHGEIIGAVQILNKRTGTFQAADELLLSALSSQAAVAIENADLYQRLSALNLSLEQRIRERTSELTDANDRLTALNRELERISVTDALTQVYNRRYLMERLRQEVKRVGRYGPPLTLLMLDIDHFKRVNDTYGHQAGDAVLIGTARMIRSKLRETDVIARYGGEEFCIVATGTDQAGGMILAERLRRLIEDERFNHGDASIAITISIGVSTWERSIGDDADELMRRADSVLYQAKEEGRNRVCAG